MKALTINTPLSEDQKILWDQLTAETAMLDMLRIDATDPHVAGPEYDRDRMRGYNRLAANVTLARMSALHRALLLSGPNVSEA